jgi:citrate synthase
VLLADHELPASTLAARIAASVRGDIYLVLGAALGSLGGPLHGGASLLVEDFLRSLPDVATAVSVVDHRIAEGDRVPGFGHAVYLDRDPRADCLLDVAGTVLARSPTWSIVEAVRGAMQRHGGPAPNIDFALGALAVCSGMGRGAGEAVFAVARCAGWVAHALEEYGRRSQFRLRAIYTGVRPR